MADTNGQLTLIIGYDAQGYANYWHQASWNLINQDALANTSLIRIRYEIFVQNGASASGLFTGSITVDGTEYAFSINESVYSSSGSQSSKILLQKDVLLNHNLDGTKTFSFSAKNNNYTFGSRTYELNTLPQATQILSFPDFVIGDLISVQLDRKSTSYTNSLTLKVGETVVKTIDGVLDSIDIQLSSSEQDIIYSSIPNTTTAIVSLYCQTKNGTQNVGGMISKNATASVSDVIIPSFGYISHVDLDINAKTLIGSYIKSISNIRVAIEGATGNKFSTIDSYKIEYNGIIFNANTIDTGPINWSGNKTIKATITDSRGRSYSQTTNLTALDYVEPVISEFSMIRCNEDGTPNELGTYVNITRKGNVTSLNSLNNYYYAIYSKARGTTNWGAAKASGASSTGTIIMDANQVIGTYSELSSYDFMFEFSDNFKISYGFFTLSSGQTVLSWSQYGIGVGKVWERGALDVDGDAYIEGSLGFRIKKADGYANDITIDDLLLIDGYTKTFIVSADNNGDATTINNKPLYIPNTTISPTLKQNRAVTVWYDALGDCFFIKASASGNATVNDVLAGKTFTNDSGEELIGALVITNDIQYAQGVINSSTEQFWWNDAETVIDTAYYYTSFSLDFIPDIVVVNRPKEDNNTLSYYTVYTRWGLYSAKALVVREYNVKYVEDTAYEPGHSMIDFIIQTETNQWTMNIPVSTQGQYRWTAIKFNGNAIYPNTPI